MGRASLRRRLRVLAAAAAVASSAVVVSHVGAAAPQVSPSSVASPGFSLQSASPAVSTPVTVSATGVAVHFPVLATGFGAAASLSAIVGITTGGGTFSLTSTSGLTSLTGYSLSGGEIGFFGNGDVVIEALADRVRWTGGGSAGSHTISVSVNQYEPGLAFNPDNGHYYEEINHGSIITWLAASNSAATRTKFGMTGYLVTITSDSENEFVRDKTTATNVWIGATDDFAYINTVTASAYANQVASEGLWHWATGPEAGTQFMTANVSTSVVAGRYASWANGEPNNAGYAAGGSGQENCAVTNWGSRNGLWNDLACGHAVSRYVVEYDPSGGASTALTASSSTPSSVVGPAELTVQVTGDGEVTSSPAGIDCGVTCSAQFPTGNTVVLTATPADGQRLVSWGGPCSGAGSCTVTLTGDQTVSATFAIVPILPPQLPGLVAEPVATTTVAPPATTVAPTTSVPSTTVPSTPPVPVPADPESGALPELAPGESAVTEDGVTTPVEVVVENSTDLVLRGADFELRLAGDCTGGCTVQTDDAGRQVIQLESDGSARVAGEGFLPGTPVYVWLFSTPTFLGELMVLDDGTFSGLVPLAGVDVGQHTLQVNGTSFDGKPRTANLGVIVTAAGTPEPQPGALPSTGQDLTGLVLGLVLIAVGVLLVITRRRTAAVGR